MAHYSESKSKLIKELGIEVPTFPELRPKQNKVALSKVESLHNDWKNAFDTILDELYEVKHALNMKYTHLCSVFQAIFSPANSDLVIQTSTGPIRVHTQVVSMWSNTIKIMLESGMRESATKCIPILDESHDHIQDMVNYMYSGHVNLDKSNCVALLRLSSYYQIESLRDLSGEFLLRNIPTKYCIVLLDMAREYMQEGVEIYKKLNVACLRKIVDNKSILFYSAESMNDIHVETINQVIYVIKAQDPSFLEESASLIGKAIQHWSKSVWGIDTYHSIIEQFQKLQQDKETKFVVKIKDGLHDLAMELHQTVMELKCKIEETEGIPAFWQDIYFDSNLLIDDATLEESGVVQGSILKIKLFQNNGMVENSLCCLYKPIYGIFSTIYNLIVNAMIKDFTDESSKAEFLILDHYTIEQILKSNNLNVEKEDVVLDFLETWFNYDKERQSVQIIYRLVPLLRLEFINTKVLLTIPTTHPIIASCCSFNNMLLNAFQCQIEKEPFERPIKKRKLYGDSLPCDSEALLSFTVKKCVEKR